MKKIFFSALAVVGLAACVQEEIQSLNPSGAISFDNAFVGNATRAAADPSTDWNTIKDFQVWGFMDQPEGYVFQGDVVQKVGDVWTYEQTQYWAPEHTYYFAAVSPVEGKHWELDAQTANTYGPGVLSFTNENGSEDLLYAATSVDTPDYVQLAAGMDPVSLEFCHLLSKVKFSFKNGFRTENARVAVENILMTAPKSATINLASENWWEGDNWMPGAETTTLAFGNVAKLEMGRKDECTQERLTIPVSKTYPYQVTFDVVLYMGEVEALRATKTTDISGVALEMGKAYNFSAEINPENLHLPAIEFYVEEVKDWIDAETPCEQVWETELKAAALLGGSYTLPGNIVLTSPVVVPAGTHFVVNLNGYSITSPVDAFEVAGGSLTINGDGTVYAASENGEPYCAVWAYGDGYVRINGGEYKVGYPAGDYNDLIYAKDNARIEIYGGYFYNSGKDNAFVLNLKDGSNASITVYGGTFQGFNPGENDSENPRASFLADGYVAVETNGEWTVLPGEIEVSTAFEFEAALAAKYQKIILLEDVALTSAATKVIGNLVLDLNGHDIIANRDYVSSLTAPQITTLYVDGVEMTVIGTGSIINEAPTSAYSIVVDNGAKVTIKGDVTVGAYHDAYYVRIGKLYIENGFHYALNSKAIPDPCSLNDKAGVEPSDCHRSTVINCYDDGATEVYITGGTFVNMNPSNVHEWRLHHMSFVVEGYTVVSEAQEDGTIWYTVVAE